MGLKKSRKTYVFSFSLSGLSIIATATTVKTFLIPTSIDSQPFFPDRHSP
ncbi:exported hypothetical protein [Kamptonema sp. PCC 6506]|nr:exported hypothetical protein [Kamptonema sp. PCC 6506]